MKIKKLAGLAMFLCIAGIAGMANAVTIVDTGDNGNHTWYTAVSDTQWVAGEFTISDDYTITGLTSIMQAGWGNSDDITATAVIYTDGGDIPGSELYSALFTVSSITDWYGVSDVSWELTSGTYWVAFEVREEAECDDIYDDPSCYRFIRATESAANPLANYAVNPLWNPDYLNSSNTGFSLRIEGEETSATPEPSTILLLAAGLMGIFSGRKKFRK
ncbi:MAG: PEP-CTERM sorting domain-containing protein [Desulfobacteraceae bacterium]|nr:PEP-CTERM sorting domain-containing protein [Desulfobacteraceae bacterium]